MEDKIPTDGERMVWAAAFAQATLAGNDFYRAAYLAYDVVQNFRRVATESQYSERYKPQIAMAAQMLSPHAKLV